MRISQQLFPRIVCLITTTDKQGNDNVMTASFIMPVSFEPKYIAFSVSPERKTFSNLKEVPEFGVNMCSKDMEEIAWACGTRSGRDADKFELLKLEKEKSSKIKPPLVKVSPISFECVVEDMKLFGDHYLVVGKVVREIVRKKNFILLLHKYGREFV